MGRYIGRRMLWAVVVLVIMITITFVIYFVMPPNTTVYERFTHGAETTQASEFTKSALAPPSSRSSPAGPSSRFSSRWERPSCGS